MLERWLVLGTGVLVIGLVLLGDAAWHVARSEV